MKFKTRKFLHEDFALVKQWADLRGFPMPMREFLPPTAITVYIDDEPMACGFMFKSDANIAVIAHLMSNPSAPVEKRHAAVEHVIKSLTLLADMDGFAMVTCSTNIESLGKRFEEFGFQRTDDKVEHYRKFL